MADLLRTWNQRLDLRRLSQFRYTQAKGRLKRKQKQRQLSEFCLVLPVLEQRQSPTEVLTRTIAQQERSLARVSLSYSRLISPERILPGLPRRHRRAYNSSL